MEKRKRGRPRKFDADSDAAAVAASDFPGVLASHSEPSEKQGRGWQASPSGVKQLTQKIHSKIRHLDAEKLAIVCQQVMDCLFLSLGDGFLNSHVNNY